MVGNLETLLIRLYGQLSAETGSRLYLEAKERLSRNHAFCLDFSRVSGMDEIGLGYLQKLALKATEAGAFLGCFGLNQAGIEGSDLSAIQSLVPSFSNELEAKLALENRIEPKSSFSLETQSVPKKPEPSQKRTFCPFCAQELNVKTVGDYSCPNCSGKFHMDSKGWARAYERLF